MITARSDADVSARECGKRFTTYEKLETLPLMIIKKDDSREPYNRAKIENGILLSCHKRPVSSDQITKMIDEIEKQIFSMEEHEIPSAPSPSKNQDGGRGCIRPFRVCLQGI